MSSRSSSVARVIVVALILVGLGLYLARRAGWGAGSWFRSRRPHVVLISIDTWRADHAGCYNPSRRITPNIDAFARAATLFRNAVAPAPITLTSHCSMLGGRVPPMHGARRNNAALADEAVTLPELLKPEGYATGAVVSAVVLDRRHGLQQGFDSYDDIPRNAKGSWQGAARPGAQASAIAMEWLRQHKDDERFFLFLHYYDPHAPYAAPEPFASRFPDEPYAAEVAYADHCVGQVLDELKRLELFDDALVIVTSDHGEMLGEHGEPAHQFFIYESAVKVPLIVKLPGQREARRVEDVVGLVDIVPTLCSLLGLPKEDLDGIDLSAYLEGKAGPPEAEDRYLYAESVVPQFYGANPLFGQVGRRWKYIHTTRPELYDLLADPEEQTNLIGAEPHRARRLESRVKSVLARAAEVKVEGGRPVLDEETRRRLHSLGYVDIPEYHQVEFDPDRDDPKDLIGCHVAFQEALVLQAKGRLEEALEKCREVVERRPGVRQAQVVVAHLLARFGQYEEALEHATIAVRLADGDPAEHARRGMIYEALGDDENALADYTKALEHPLVDPWVYVLRAKVLARRGEVEAAITDAENAKRLSPPGSENWTAAEELRIRLTSGSGKVQPFRPLPRAR